MVRRSGFAWLFLLDVHGVAFDQFDWKAKYEKAAALVILAIVGVVREARGNRSKIENGLSDKRQGAEL